MKLQIKRYAAELAAILVVFGVTNNTNAAISITTSASAPATDVIISQTSSDVPEQVKKTANSVANWRELGQTFTLTDSFLLQKLSLLVSDDTGLSAGGNSISIDIFTAASVSSSNGVSVLGFPDSGTIPAFAASTLRWMTFDFPDVQLSPGLYGFKIGFPTIGVANNFASTNTFGDTGLGVHGIWLDQDNPYSGGRAFRLRPTTGSTGLTGDPDNDFAFVLQGIPEPSSMALLAVGGLLALRGMRKSRA